MRKTPKCLTHDRARIWECTSYIRRVTTSRARMMWCVRVMIPDRLGVGGASSLDLWWLTHHFWIENRVRVARRRHGPGNVFMVRCGNEALLLTNARKAEAFELLQRVRREVFWEKFHSLPHMRLHHLDDGVPFHDLWIQFKAPNDGRKRRLFVRPSERTLLEFRQAVKRLCRVREGKGRWARKPKTIVQQWNALMERFWGRFRYADWDVITTATPRGLRQRPEYELLERWARKRLYHKVRQEVVRRNTRRIARAKDKGWPTDKMLPARIANPRAFAAALYRNAVRFGEGKGPRAQASRIWLGARKMWRLGQEPAEVAPPAAPKEADLLEKAS